MDEPSSEHESDAKPLEFSIPLGSKSDGKLQLKQAVKEENRNKRENQKTRRGYGKKNARKNIKHVKFSLLGANSNGLLGKQESLKNAINEFKPCAITIQESKLNKAGQVKLKGYQIFEKIRQSGQGGGLLTTVDEDLNPILVSTGSEEETELITVQVQVGKHDIRIINAYGPQETDTNAKIFNFWEDIENEVIAAKDNNCMIVIQMDANAKIGKEILKNDPNEQSNNGKILLEMVERQGLVIANTLDKCKGLITRERKAGDNLERAVLDYLIICEGMKEFLEHMTVDEERIYTLTKYTGKKSVKKTLSDHNVMIANVTFKFDRQPRKTSF